MEISHELDSESEGGPEKKKPAYRKFRRPVPKPPKEIALAGTRAELNSRKSSKSPTEVFQLI